VSDTPYALIPRIFCCYIQFSKYCLHSNLSDVIHNYVGSVQKLFEDPNYPPPVNVTTFNPLSSSCWNKLLCFQYKSLIVFKSPPCISWPLQGVFITELFVWLVKDHVWPLGLQLDQPIFNPYKILKRRFSPLVGGEYSLSDIRNLYSRLTVTPRNLSG
jgi:hypothetical protein